MLYAKYFLERLFFNIILIVSRVINIRAKYVIVIFTSLNGDCGSSNYTIFYALFSKGFVGVSF